MSKLECNVDILFELSWEVCNKVGGIYTVVMSKAALMKKYANKYILIGPYIEEKSKFEMEDMPVPSEWQDCFKELKAEGIICHYGKWRIKGEPSVILIDFKNYTSKKNDIKKQLWEEYKIDSLKAQWDFEEPMVWSYSAGLLIEKIRKKTPDGKISVQCHEWMAGFALLYLKKHTKHVGTVFTTHATMLGRSMAGNNLDLYNLLDKVNPQEEAYRLQIEAKHLTEKACALTSDVFTTVSEITALEAEKFWGRKADVLVLNGLDIDKFPTIEETSIKHITVREKIREFLTYFFFPYYTMELQHNLIYYIIGRYEFHNKGIDVLIKALGKLNERLKKEEMKRTISVFFWIPAGHKGLKTQVLENKTYFRHIKNFVNFHSEEIINKTVSNIVSQKKLTIKEIFSEEFFEHLQKDILHFKRSGDPPLTTHYMEEEKDAMITELRRNGLNNKEDDKVKVIVYPVYLDGTDDLINLGYYDTISGCHLGLFPSYYEPYGYTPLESAALGVPSVTTDLSGFGMFIEKHVHKNKEGIFVLHRAGKNEEEIIQECADIMYSFAKLSHRERVQNKTVAKSLAGLADWSILIKNYINAHNMAVEKVK